MLIVNARRLAAAIALVVVAAPLAHAQTATQTVTFAVNAINQIAFLGAPSLTITRRSAPASPATCPPA